MKSTIPAYRRHDLSDETWALLESHLPGRKGVWGGVSQNNRLFINAVSGFCALVRRGGICRRITAAGAIRIAVSSVGVRRAFGKSCLKS